MVLVPCPECQQQVSSSAATCPHCGIALAGGAPGLSPAAAPAGPEQAVWEGKPSVLLLVGALFRTALVALVLSFLAVFAYRLLASPAGAGAGRSGTAVAGYLAAAVILCLLPSLYGVLSTLLRIKSIGYKLTNQRLLVERGLFARTLEEIDLRYVDETTFSQGFLERLLGIGEVRVVSSDKVAPNLVVRGIRDPRGVREAIRAQAYQASQRQFFTRST